MGIEKVMPSFRDLEVMLQLLPRSSTGERMNPYTSIWTGVRAGDGPGAFHLVLLDNGRTRPSRTRSGATRFAASAARPASTSARSTARRAATPTTRRTRGRSARSCSRSSTGSVAPRRRCRSPRPSAAPARTSARCGSTSRRSWSTSARGRRGDAARARSGALKRLGRVSAPRRGYERAQRLAVSLQRPFVRAAGSGASRPARCARGGAAAICRRCRADVPRVVGVVSAREVVLERVRRAVESAGPPRSAALRRGGPRRTPEVEAFVERIRDYRATVLARTTPGGVAEVLRGRARVGSGSRRISRAAPSGRGRLVEDDALSPQQLDELDGALTTCAAPARYRHDRARRRPGQGRRR